eukprot:4806412-Pyramimonas_sp.AAC.1
MARTVPTLGFGQVSFKHGLMISSADCAAPTTYGRYVVFAAYLTLWRWAGGAGLLGGRGNGMAQA